MALEDSKLHQSVQLRPSTLQIIVSKPDGVDQAETVDTAGAVETVQVTNRNSVIISILNKEDRGKLFDCEKLLKTGITKNLAIKLDGYGWVSSLWSLQQIKTPDNPVNLALQSFLNDLKSVRDKYKNEKYRVEMADEIGDQLKQVAINRGISLSREEDQKIKDYLGRFVLKIDDKKSPYRSLERLYNKVTSDPDGSILPLLSPYKIGGDENSETHDDFLSPDQLNLVVMCKLAAKLRSKNPSKAPAVWWFDFALALDQNIFKNGSVAEYKEETKGKLEKIIDDILDDINLDKCLENFCQITGFNLALKYPEMHDPFVLRDTNQTILDDETYVFVDSQKKRHNLPRFFPAFDDQKRPSEWREAKMYSEKIKGKFVLGNNLFFWFDEKTENTYLYASE